ncbi:MAG: hypothetical protein R2787_10845 [Saprospiraceae bacterium]
MVTVVSYATRENLDGEEYIALVLQGDLEMVQSQETGRFYATARKTTISSTFNEATAAGLIGTQIPGRIDKVPCEPYEWVVPETGELIELEFRYEYVPEGEKPKVPKVKPVPVPERMNPVFSGNGEMVV